jgi:TfoX/Sxy family transcriptional regulator of competence genes
MTFDPGLVARVADALDQIGEPGIRQKNVFGGRGFMLGKHAFVIVGEDGIIAKLAPDDYPGALKEPGVTPFAPGGERPMGTWVVVDAEVIADDPELTDWIRRALRAVR